MTYYAGDVDVEITLGPLSTGDVDGTTIDSARVIIVRPSGGASIELAVAIAAQDVESVTLQHITDGAIATAGRWLLRAYYYDGATLVATSKEAALDVAARIVPLPT